MGVPYLSEVRLFSYNWAPRGWARCDGQLLPINQNQALYSLLGTMYGGDGRTTFALPDLRGRTATHFNNQFQQGAKGGSEKVTLTISQMPSHYHSFQGTSATGTDRRPEGLLPGTNSAGENFYGPFDSPQQLNPTSISNTGGNNSHNNMQPYLVLNYCMAMAGAFPSRN